MCWCDDHVRRKGVKYDRNAPIPCPKCGFETNETKELSMSTKTHKYGRQQEGEKDDMSDRYYAWQSMIFFTIFLKVTATDLNSLMSMYELDVLYSNIFRYVNIRSNWCSWNLVNIGSRKNIRQF